MSPGYDSFQGSESAWPISPDDYKKLRQWNGGEAGIIDRCVHDLIAERVEADPDGLAVHSWDGDLSYQELDENSSALAAFLATKGVHAEVIVPLCFEKSRWSIISLLAVMKAGGVYVFLDPSQPQERLQSICDDTRSQLVLASELYGSLAAQLTRDVVTVNSKLLRICSSLRDPSSPSSKALVTPRNALYIVYTSGSTGKPKGVVIEHRSFSTGALQHARTLGLNRQSRVLQFSSYAFDVCMAEMLTTLAVGGCICVPSDQDRIQGLARVINKLRVNWACLTPSVSRILSPEEVPLLQTLAVVGEPITATDIARWSGPVRFINTYGPAEATVYATARTEFGSCASSTEDYRGIGFPMSCTTWVVDPSDHDLLTPVGEVGELLLEGPIVARGYLHRPELSRDRFPERPTWRHLFPASSSSDRFYKTGDLVQHAADGSLLFIGRKDTQPNSALQN
ncbi:AMP-dependent synthetase and ligase [Aspergillus indologenus CBS 114.80]|uniref:AMP-dependent synthetase and ligase n=1 Tax=Aspergillus indologenus CBS 114.80 TaxID=1450541 RepID=A0A2V5HQT5_9EURO|nr:AMP-dependent synthetase and ligase [Aspergillus indologenus CBS 114.80]